MMIECDFVHVLTQNLLIIKKKRVYAIFVDMIISTNVQIYCM